MEQARMIREAEQISIHALREEGDARIWVLEHLGEISIHALREEGDTPTAGRPANSRKFLSTPSARRATSRRSRLAQEGSISIHALREEGDVTALSEALHTKISIHALREEGDIGVVLEAADLEISIHALREEGDRCGVSPHR